MCVGRVVGPSCGLKPDSPSPIATTPKTTQTLGFHLSRVNSPESAQNKTFGKKLAARG